MGICCCSPGPQTSSHQAELLLIEHLSRLGFVQRSESPRSPEESLYLARRWKVPLAFGKARLTDRRAGRRRLFCREECKQRDSNHAKDRNVLGAILPVHP